MQNGNSARRYVLLGVALVALVALTVSLGAGAASAGPGHAVTSKKKCKKAKKGAASAKKKKCKHKKHATVTPPATTPSGPTTRASITWDTITAEVDLHTYDASGDHSGFAPPGGFAQEIPNAHGQDESTDGGPDTFVDNESPSTRTFTFYVCLHAAAGLSGNNVHVTADITDPGGAHRSIPVTLNDLGEEKIVTVSPGSGTAYVPVPDNCGLAA
jgi:hypothetical protein